MLNPKSKDFVTTTHSQVKNKIEKAYEIHKDTVRKKLQSALTRIHLSVDIWTSPNKHLLLGVTTDFIDCVEEKYCDEPGYYSSVPTCYYSSVMPKARRKAGKGFLIENLSLGLV